MQVVSLSAIAFFTYSNICQLWRILLSYLFLIFVLSLPRKLISITFQSHLLQEINFYSRAFLLSLFCCKHFLETLIKSKILKFTLENRLKKALVVQFASIVSMPVKSFCKAELFTRADQSDWKGLPL